MYAYDTLTEALADLRRRGYTHDYNLQDGQAVRAHDRHVCTPEELQIDEVYRFEGMTNPDDEAVLYALQARPDGGQKGVMVAAYGTYTSEEEADFLKKLEARN